MKNCVSLTPAGSPTCPRSTRSSQVVPVRGGPTAIKSGSRSGAPSFIGLLGYAHWLIRLRALAHWTMRSAPARACFHHELKVAFGFARRGFNLISRPACERARKFMRQKRAQQPEIIFEAQWVGRECAP